jgi:peptidoglycan/xylan/chitin deacetylase (PgdA/CDA1 family)
VGQPVSPVGPMIEFRLTEAGEYNDATWAEGLRFKVPSDLPSRLRWPITASGDLSMKGALPVPPADVGNHRLIAAFTDRPPASARLPVSYQHVPGRLRAVIGSAIGRWNRRRTHRWASFPGWPLDLSADLLFDLSLPTSPPPVTAAPVVLTHDIDSAEGLQNLVERFLDAEESVGARSTNYIVPCAWPIDEGLVSAAKARGHEIGVHGYDHSNRTAFADDTERRRRLDATMPFATRHGATSYRAPSLLRTRELMRDLAARYARDSSIPTSGGLFPVPNNGCASARPFLVEGILELPLSMPRDGSLRFLGYTSDEILRMWIDCADLIARSRGVVVLLTHCERRFSGEGRMFEAYRRFLEYVAERPERFRFSRMSDIQV